MSHLPNNPFLSADGKKPTCLEMLQLILDNQATPIQCEYFRTHMDHCMPCFKSYHLDMAIKELVQSRCCASAPAELVTKIKSQIAQKIS
jgi:mycothiol system anti-sigma-R factor